MGNILTTEEVAEKLKLSKQRIYTLVANKEIPFIRIGGALRFDESEIIEWLKQKKQ